MYAVQSFHHGKNNSLKKSLKVIKSWWVYANFWKHLDIVASYKHINCILFCFGWVLYLFSFFLGAQWHTSCCNNISFGFSTPHIFSCDALGKSWPSVVCMDASKFIIVKASDKLIYCACYNAERMLIKGNDNNVYFKETTTGLYTCSHKHVSHHHSCQPLPRFNIRTTDRRFQLSE